MSVSIKFNGGRTLIIFDGPGSATLASLGLATQDEVDRYRVAYESAQAALEDAQAGRPLRDGQGRHDSYTLTVEKLRALKAELAALKADYSGSATLAAMDAKKAELAEVRAERDALLAWQLAVADGIGFVNRAEGQGGYEVASPGVIVEYVKGAGRERDALRDDLEAERRDGLTVAEGAALRAELAATEALVDALRAELATTCERAAASEVMDAKATAEEMDYALGQMEDAIAGERESLRRAEAAESAVVDLQHKCVDAESALATARTRIAELEAEEASLRILWGNADRAAHEFQTELAVEKAAHAVTMSVAKTMAAEHGFRVEELCAQRDAEKAAHAATRERLDGLHLSAVEAGRRTEVAEARAEEYKREVELRDGYLATADARVKEMEGHGSPKKKCGAWSHSLAGACDQPEGHDGAHVSAGDVFAAVPARDAASEAIRSDVVPMVPYSEMVAVAERVRHKAYLLAWNHEPDAHIANMIFELDLAALLKGGGQ